jgi:hypothetical protein
MPGHSVARHRRLAICLWRCDAVGGTRLPGHRHCVLGCRGSDRATRRWWMPALTGALPRRRSSGCPTWASLPRTRRPTPSRAPSPGISETLISVHRIQSSWPGLSRPFRLGRQCRARPSGMPGTRPGMTGKRDTSQVIPGQPVSGSQPSAAPRDDNLLPQLLNFTPVIASRLPCQIFSLSAFGMSMPSMMRKVSRVYIVPFSGSNGQSEANTILSRS